MKWLKAELSKRRRLKGEFKTRRSEKDELTDGLKRET